MCGFDPAFQGPVFGMICRLTEQKGIDLVLANADFFTAKVCRFVILGAGEKRMEDALQKIALSYPEKVFVCPKHDETMSHLIESGSDFFVMPSLFEPCGLNQMYSQVYGTVPIVSRVGGLFDTVRDADEDLPNGTGVMCAPNAVDLRGALERSLRLYDDKARYGAVQQRGMARDFSWKTAALAYETLYRDAL